MFMQERARGGRAVDITAGEIPHNMGKYVQLTSNPSCFTHSEHVRHVQCLLVSRSVSVFERWTHRPSKAELTASR